MTKPEVELTEAEWSIIKAVWDNEPCTATAIQEKLSQPMGWAYSTVRTLMDRMVAKGALSSRKEGKFTFYTSAVTRGQAQRGELMYALRNAFNGALSPMMQCMLDAKEVSAAEIGELKDIIAAYENGVPTKPKTKPGRRSKL